MCCRLLARQLLRNCACLHLPTCLALLQWFVVGHDCGHRSFSKNKLVEDIVGTLMFMPLIYPFEPWRIKHNQHHAHTNKCACQHLSRLHGCARACLPAWPCSWLAASSPLRAIACHAHSQGADTAALEQPSHAH